MERSAASSSFRPQGSNTDLVAEIQTRQRGRRVKRIIVTISAVTLLIAAGIGTKIAFDRNRVEQTLEQAREHVAAATRTSLQQAEHALQSNLALAPSDDDTLALLAVVEARRMLEQQVPRADVESLLRDTASLDGPELDVARGMLALEDGAFADALNAAEQALIAAEDGSVAERYAVWLQGLAASNRLESTQLLDAVRTRLDEAFTANRATADHYRVAAAVAFRQGDAIGSLELLERGRKAHTDQLSLAVDEALVHALLRKDCEAVVSAADTLAQREEFLSPRDRGRATLARAACNLHLGHRERAIADLERAHAELPTWDRDAHDFAFDVAFYGAASELMRKWIEQREWPEGDKNLYAAWLALLEGRPRSALEGLEKLPQDHPRVAYVAGLAMVELRKFDEARPLLDRAQTLVSGAAALTVALARIELAEGDADKAKAELEPLLANAGQIPRSRTAMAESLLTNLRTAKLRSTAEEALRDAIEHEPAPAEALLQLATLEDIKARKDPKRIDSVLELHQRAVEANPETARFLERRGMYLAHLGLESRAEKVLKTAIELPDHSADGLLALANTTIERAEVEHQTPPDVEEWLAAAEERGAKPRDLELVRARIEWHEGGEAALASARDRLTALVDQNPKDADARVELIRIMLRTGDIDAADEAIRAALRKISQRGRILQLRAAVAEKKGKKRDAARFAWDGWKRMLREHRPVRELIEAAKFSAHHWVSLRQPSAARGIARDLEESAPHHSDTWVFLTRMQLEAELPGSPNESARRAVELDPKNAAAHALLGESYLKQGEKAQAKEAYGEAAKLAEGTPVARQYAKILARL